MDARPIDVNELEKKRREKRLAVRIGVAAVIVLAALIVILNSTYTVGEAEAAVISRLGVITDIVVSPENTFVSDNADLMDMNLSNVNVIYGKGLMFRLPFITDVAKYDSRLFSFISDSSPVNTAEKKQYFITIYAQWSIGNPGLFAITQQSTTKADHYLDNLIFPVIIQSINNLTADQFINNKEVLNAALADALDTINTTVRDSGIRINDIQVHRTLLPPANLQSTYERMMADRRKVAQSLRAEGEEAYQKAVAQADREAREIRSDALRESERIRGEADAEALEIYAKAYTRDAEFYTYWRSLKALEASLDEDSVLILDSAHPLIRDIYKWIEPEDVSEPESKPVDGAAEPQ